MVKKNKSEYRVPATCYVCGRKFLARYNCGNRTKTCTPPTHECRRKTVKVPGRRDKLVACVDGCCRSRYYRGASVSMTSSAIDARKFLSGDEYRKVVAATHRLEGPFGITIRFILETGCRLGEALLVRPDYFEWKTGPLSIVRMPTLKKAGHPQLPVHIDNRSDLAREMKGWLRRVKPGEPCFPVARRTLQRAFERIIDRIKPDRASLVHLLRHTRASRLIAAGFDWNYVRAQLRWSSIELAKIYVHTTEESVGKLMERLR